MTSLHNGNQVGSQTFKDKTGKTKVMFGCSMKDRVEDKGKWLCGVCKNGVCNNSILCHIGNKWIHKQCSGEKGSLLKANQPFICRSCKVDRPITDGLNTDLYLDFGNGVSLETVDKFCNFWDMLVADGGCDSAVVARVRSAWKKFREYLPILTGKRFSLKLKGKVYATYRMDPLVWCVTWPMKVEHEVKMNRTEMNMITWTCGVKLYERKKSEELLGLERVRLMKKNRLRWFGHVEHKDANDWVQTLYDVGSWRNQTEDTKRTPGGTVLRMKYKFRPVPKWCAVQEQTEKEN